MNHPMKGKLFETYVVMEILKNLKTMSLFLGLYHYRTQAGAEVDLILEFRGKLYPIEVKLTSYPSKNDARGIHSFYSSIPEQEKGKGLIVCTCEKPYLITEEILALPWWMI